MSWDLLPSGPCVGTTFAVTVCLAAFYSFVLDLIKILCYVRSKIWATEVHSKGGHLNEIYEDHLYWSAMCYELIIAEWWIRNKHIENQLAFNGIHCAYCSIVVVCEIGRVCGGIIFDIHNTRPQSYGYLKLFLPWHKRLWQGEHNSVSIEWKLRLFFLTNVREMMFVIMLIFKNVWFYNNSTCMVIRYRCCRNENVYFISYLFKTTAKCYLSTIIWILWR